MKIENNELMYVPNKDIKNGTFIIPNNVTKISKNTFARCDSLESIIIPDSVTKIREGAFKGCTNLKDVVLSKNLNEIEDSLFGFCYLLEKITIPNGVTRIGTGAFRSCIDLKIANIPNSVETIESAVFDGCCSLEKITIPDSVKYIGEHAFFNCKSLKDIDIYSYKTFNLLDKNQKTIAILSTLKNYYNKRIKYTEEDMKKFTEYTEENKLEIKNYIFDKNKSLLLLYLFAKAFSSKKTNIDKELMYIILFKLDDFITQEETFELLEKSNDNEIRAMLLEYSKRFTLDPFEKFNLNNDFDDHKKYYKK